MNCYPLLLTSGISYVAFYFTICVHNILIGFVFSNRTKCDNFFIFLQRNKKVHKIMFASYVTRTLTIHNIFILIKVHSYWKKTKSFLFCWHEYYERIILLVWVQRHPNIALDCRFQNQSQSGKERTSISRYEQHSWSYFLLSSIKIISK